MSQSMQTEPSRAGLVLRGVEHAVHAVGIDWGANVILEYESALRSFLVIAQGNQERGKLRREFNAAASLLGLSVKTVDAHKFNLMRKLGIHNKAELVMWAIQKRVVKLPVNL